MKDDWLSRLFDIRDKLDSVLILSPICPQCRVNSFINKIVVLNTILPGKDVPDHSTILTIICNDCAKDLDPDKIYDNILDEVLSGTAEIC